MLKYQACVYNGDILLGDRAFSDYASLAELPRKGVDSRMTCWQSWPPIWFQNVPAGGNHVQKNVGQTRIRCYRGPGIPTWRSFTAIVTKNAQPRNQRALFELHSGLTAPSHEPMKKRL